MRNITLILQQSVAGLGEAGDVVKSKPGYARNFLIPQGKAIFATESNVSELEHQKRVVAGKVAKELESLGAVRAKIESLDLQVKARVGEEGKLFGSITAANVAALLAEAGIEVDRRRISLPEAIKELGQYSVSVKLHRDLVAEAKLTVSAEE